VVLFYPKQGAVMFTKNTKVGEVVTNEIGEQAVVLLFEDAGFAHDCAILILRPLELNPDLGGQLLTNVALFTRPMAQMDELLDQLTSGSIEEDAALLVKCSICHPEDTDTAELLMDIKYYVAGEYFSIKAKKLLNRVSGNVYPI
jgi:hypothetical protein